MPSNSIDMQIIMNKLYTDRRPTALYLPVASFQSTTEPCEDITVDNFGFYKSDRVICFLLFVPALHFLQYYRSRSQPLFTPNYVLTDLSLSEQTVGIIKNVLADQKSFL